MSRSRLANIIAAALLVTLLIGGAVYYRSLTKGKAKPSAVLVIFHAGSLSVPFAELGREFMRQNPGIKVQAESAGSRHCARKISDLGRRADIMASADYKVVTNLLMPAHADFNVRFATNEMAIAYTKRSGRAAEFSAASWPAILSDPKVRVGRSDPNSDPCGYRTVMTLQLAERHYKLPGLAKRLGAKDGRRYIRPKETDLLALLEAGEIDYLFIYRSVAEQHRLQRLLLPDEVNLKKPALAALYGGATVRVTGKKPGSFITRRGEPMVYSVTIPKRAPNRKAALAFMRLLLSPAGRAIIERNGQPFLNPVVVDGPERLPAALRGLIR